ncbi:MAG: PAS and helix-turn-helix domain-containing protein [Rhizobiales bacterium]|nr:PAS and helix-turn-helix domain-containing protein [Hyphomicrobiales bacterium]NRB14902.1 PAS and helix-turn-helix domain-containing protein [Hyphomicrobiales bacterium]
MQFTLEELPVPFVYAKHRVIEDCNLSFASLFGYKRQELLGSGFHLLYPRFADFLRTGEMWQTHMSHHKTYYDERIMRHYNQTEFWCRVRGQSSHADDPFAAALYNFEPMNRIVEPKHHQLTDRQLQIITLVAQGKKNREIALEINRSPRTVEMHRAKIMQQIGVANAAQMIAWFERKKIEL